MNRRLSEIAGHLFALGGSVTVVFAWARLLGLIEAGWLEPFPTAAVGMAWVVVGQLWLWGVRQQEQMDNRLEAHRAWMAELEERGVDE